MKQFVADLWVAALRSGEYKKGKGALKLLPGGYDEVSEREVHTTSHCCLGVLTECYNKAHPKDAFDFKDQADIDNLLPEKVQEWAGLKSRDGRHTKANGKDTTLDTINDSLTAKRGFQYIASVIERHAKEL